MCMPHIVILVVALVVVVVVAVVVIGGGRDGRVGCGSDFLLVGSPWDDVHYW